MKKVALAFAMLLPLCVTADAATVVTTCGSPPVPYVAGSTRPITVDTTGKLCV